MLSSRLAFAACCLLLLPAAAPTCGQNADAPIVVLVIRHAEKAAEQGDDPNLTQKGAQRAQALLNAVGDAAVTAIYSSQYKRTQDAVAPLAEHLNVPITTVEISGANLSAYPKQLAGRILRDHAGETVVVVNHSNTVPLIVEALGGTAVPAITEEEYDDFCIVVIPSQGTPRTIHAQYGLDL